MIVFLTEEPSIKPVLVQIMNNITPNGVEGIDWSIQTFSGKADLKSNFPKKMKGWTYNDPHFIIMRDNDGADCIALKDKFTKLAEPINKPFNIRIVCQELESWFIGDLNAVELAYPSSKAMTYQQKSKYRDPDKLTNAAEELEKIVQVKSKLGKAEKIAPHLNLLNNTSNSFNILMSTVNGLI